MLFFLEQSRFKVSVGFQKTEAEVVVKPAPSSPPPPPPPPALAAALPTIVSLCPRFLLYSPRLWHNRSWGLPLHPTSNSVPRSPDLETSPPWRVVFGVQQRSHSGGTTLNTLYCWLRGSPCEEAGAWCCVQVPPATSVFTVLRKKILRQLTITTTISVIIFFDYRCPVV